MHFFLTFCSVNGTRDYTSPENEKYRYSFSPCQHMSCFPGQPDTAAVSCVHVSLVKVHVIDLMSFCRVLNIN